MRFRESRIAAPDPRPGHRQTGLFGAAVMPGAVLHIAGPVRFARTQRLSAVAAGRAGRPGCSLSGHLGHQLLLSAGASFHWTVASLAQPRMTLHRSNWNVTEVKGLNMALARGGISKFSPVSSQ